MSDARRKRRAEQRARNTGTARTERKATFPLAALWASLGLVVAVGIAYWPTHAFGFVRFDDPTYVTENPHIVNGVTWSGIQWAFTSGYGANWHPLTWLSHMLDVQLFGFDGGAHHVTNMLIHALTTVLLLAVLVRMTGALWQSIVVAGLFGLHPIHVESVAWVAERKDVLSAFFWVLTLWAYTSYARRPRAAAYAWVVGMFALGLMAKPMVVTLPFVLLLLDLWPLRRIELNADWWTSARHLVWEKLPLFALSIASSVITFAVQRQGGTVASSAGLPLAGRLGNAMIAYVGYIAKMFWPLHLAAYYPYARPLPTTLVAVSALLLTVATLGAIALARRRPYVLVGWLWYLGTLIPAIGIVQVGTQSMADRYTYIPLIGISIILAWGIPDAVSRWPESKVVTASVAIVALIACTIATRIQVRYWESSTTLWKHALAVTTNNYAAHTYYGNALATSGDIPGAIAEYTEAIRIRPDYPEAHNNIGPALAAQGKLDDAISHFTEAIRLRPNYADAYSNLGVALASRGKFDEAITQYRQSIRLDPDNARAHMNLGISLQASGQGAEAARELELAVRMNPASLEARNALSALQAKRQ
jgi:Flp pilus assembly protein TadD